MRILLVSYLFPPVLNPQAIVSARLAKYLERAGHTVLVIAASHAKEFDSDHGVDAKLLGTTCSGRIRYVADRNPGGFLLGIREKLLFHEHFGHWARRTRQVGRALTKSSGVDVIYSLGAPLASNVAGMRLSRELGVPWVTHFSDPIYLSIGKRFKSPLRHWITASTERKLLKRADGITFVNAQTLEKSTAFFPAYRAKCVVVPHCFDPEDFVQDVVPKRAGDAFRICYVGSLYSRRNPFDAIAALDCARRRVEWAGAGPELHLYGAVAPEIRVEIDALGLDWLKVHGPVSYRDSINALFASDVLLLIDMPDEENLYTPSKVVDYLAAMKPIVGITSKASGSARLLARCGQAVVSPGDVEGLTELFVSFIRGGAPVVGKPQEEVLVQFRADRVVQKVASVLEDTIRAGRIVGGPRRARGDSRPEPEGGR